MENTFYPDAGTRFDLRWATIGHLVDELPTLWGASELALVDGDAAWTWDELRADSYRAAQALRAAGVVHGDRVAIWAPNSAAWVIALGGLHLLGAALVPINTRFKGAEAAYLLARSGAAVLFTVGDFLGMNYPGALTGALTDEGAEVTELPSLRQVVLLDNSAPKQANETPFADFLATGAAESSESIRADLANRRGHELADVMFTSGTTGKPKGVMATHSQDLRVFGDWSDAVGLRAGDQYLIVNPFFHAFGYKAGILASMMRGATMRPEAIFDVERVLERIANERISMLPGPPTLFQSILHHPRRSEVDLTSLRLAVTGAAAIPTSLIVAMRDDLGFERVVTGYGLTEACGTVTMCRADDDPETIATTSGRAIPGVEVAIFDESGTAQPPNTDGEIVCRGYNVMVGYFDDPEQTAATIDTNGWLHTGDVGTLDERGYIKITDRLKDLFIVGGFNAYPAEIEATLVTHPAVAQAAVIGVPDDRLGEVGLAFVMVRPGVALSADDLIAWSRERMANYKVPRFVRVVETLPLTASGKVHKPALRRTALSTKD